MLEIIILTNDKQKFLPKWIWPHCAVSFLTFGVEGDEITLPGIKFKFQLFWNIPQRKIEQKTIKNFCQNEFGHIVQ